ncbi:MAG: hypothetical protein OFPI_27810 [Osedax symbiont Rs2]|nr:MAG: hypothetical protein OFPI_27810 [Osedax symbiont Rs2]
MCSATDSRALLLRNGDWWGMMAAFSCRHLVQIAQLVANFI